MHIERSTHTTLCQLRKDTAVPCKVKRWPYVPSWTHDGIGMYLRGYAQIAKRGNRSYLNCTVTVGTRRRCLQGEALPYPMEHLNTCKLYDEYFTTSLKKPILMDSLLTCLRSTPTISVSSTQQYSKTKKKIAFSYHDSVRYSCEAYSPFWNDVGQQQ